MQIPSLCINDTYEGWQTLSTRVRMQALPACQVMCVPEQASIALVVQISKTLRYLMRWLCLCQRKLYEHWHLNYIDILCWLNALVITSEYPKCVSVMLRKRNQSTTKSKPRLEFSTSLSLCFLPSPVCNLSVTGIWLCVCLCHLGNLPVSVSVCMSLTKGLGSVFIEQQRKCHIGEGMKKSLKKSLSFTRDGALLSPSEPDNK